MKKFLFIALLFTVVMQCSAQQIEVKTSIFKKPVYKEAKEEISSDVVLYILRKSDNQKAYQLYAEANKKSILAKSLVSLGITVSLYSVYSALHENEETNWTYAGVGAALFATSLPINKKANQDIKNALDLYNSDITDIASGKIKPTLVFSGSASGLGFAFQF